MQTDYNTNGTQGGRSANSNSQSQSAYSFRQRQQKVYHQKYPEQYFNVQGPTDNMSYGDAVNFAYERMRMINEMPLQKDDMHVSEKINDQDYFRMANHNSLRSNQTALATFNGLDTYNPNEHGEIPMPKLNEHQNLGESFG